MKRDKSRKADDNTCKTVSAPWHRKMGLPHTEYMRWTWKAECGESRTLRLGAGKDRKVLPIATPTNIRG